MARKVFNVNIELNIHAATCPGVWLCPNGKVTLSIYMLGAITNTLPIDPQFPLLFHERFIFTKTIKTARFLTDIDSILGNEQIYIELIQWSDGDLGLVLATFEASVLDVLYPSSEDKDIIAGIDVDLLMEPTISFPGIIAPKIEISSKTTIEETLKDVSVNKIKEPNLINPKLVTSKNLRCERRKSPIRQKKVCHSIAKREPSSPCRTPPKIKSSQPTHNILFCYETPPSSKSGKDYFKRTEPMWRSKSGKLYQGLPKKESAPPKLPLKHTHDYPCEPGLGCHICSKYKSYFEEKPPNSQVAPPHHCSCSTSKVNDQARAQKKREENKCSSCKIENLVASTECPEDLENFRQLFYSNLEKFYHRLYKKAKYKARTERCNCP